MKKGILYILLFTYASMVAKPLLPYVADAISHTLFYNDHMSTVHFENGRFHVHNEAIDAAKETNDASKTTAVKKESNWDHIISFTPWLNHFKIKETAFQEYRLPANPAAFTGQHFTPPR